MVARDRFNRLQIMLDDAEIDAVETWRFNKRMPSRAAAVRELLRRGLSAEGFEVAPIGNASQTYGVINTPAQDERDPD